MCQLRLRQRSAKRQSVTKPVNAIRSNASLSEVDIDFYIAQLQDLKTSLLKLDSEIEMDMMSDSGLTQYNWEQHSDSCESYQDNIGVALTLLKSELKKVNNSNVREHVPTLQNNPVSVSSLPKLKLPQVELPKFDGKPENFEKFSDSLEKLFDKFSLTQFEKYSYLLGQVSGSARQIVESVPMGEMNYDVARKLLSDAFSGKVNQQFSVIEKFVKLKLDSNSKPYGWISECRVLVQQMTRLEISSEVFAQYFVWQSLSDKFKQQFMSITNKSKPDLNDILDNAFDVIDRISEGNEKVEPELLARKLKNESKTVTLATNVESNPYKFISYRNCCWLCQSGNDPQATKHRIHNCKKFPFVDATLTHIRSLGGCVKCGLLNHTVDVCIFNFAKACDNCQGNHASFLCVS